MHPHNVFGSLGEYNSDLHQNHSLDKIPAQVEGLLGKFFGVQIPPDIWCLEAYEN